MFALTYLRFLRHTSTWSSSRFSCSLPQGDVHGSRPRCGSERHREAERRRHYVPDYVEDVALRSCNATVGAGQWVGRVGGGERRVLLWPWPLRVRVHPGTVQNWRAAPTQLHLCLRHSEGVRVLEDSWKPGLGLLLEGKKMLIYIFLCTCVFFFSLSVYTTSAVYECFRGPLFQNWKKVPFHLIQLKFFYFFKPRKQINV